MYLNFHKRLFSLPCLVISMVISLAFHAVLNSFMLNRFGDFRVVTFPRTQSVEIRVSPFSGFIGDVQT